MAEQTMAEIWDSYARRVMSPNAPPIQHQECRRAFYAGGEGLLVAIMNALDPGEEPTDADLDRMNSLHAELEQFADDVVKGKA